MAEKRDHRQEVTDEIIRLIEAGTPPWRKGWDTGILGVPVNAASHKPYRGGNILTLMASELKHGYNDNRWMTYKQASESGYQVRKGEHSTRVEYWQMVTANATDDNGDSATVIDHKARPIHKVYSVFNAAQVDGIEPIERIELPEMERVLAVDEMVTRSGATITHDSTKAYYNILGDDIHMPPTHAFEGVSEYYGTLLHEMTHWTGHASRLDRTMKGDKKTSAYAYEELVAELASAFLTAETGIDTDRENSAAYIASWLRGLKDDKNLIFKAASAASKASDYILAYRNAA
jgi:antirestriction protein ArdC